MLEQIITLPMLLYAITGGVFGLLVGALSVDRNGEMGILIVLPIVGAIVAPISAFVLSLWTGILEFSLPGLVIPLMCVLGVTVLLTYGCSIDISVSVKT